MDNIEQRLRETSENCLTAYASWSNARREPKAREAMAEAVHELRKVAARLEIDLAASEREELAQRPIPIPPHRSSQKRSQDENNLPSFITRGGGPMDEGDDDNDNTGNGGNGGNGGHSQRQGGGGQHRRPHGGGGNGGKTVTLERRFTGGRRGSAGGSAGGGQAAESGNAQPAAAAPEAPAAAPSEE